MFSWNSIGKPIVALAPMSGVTDAAFRQCTKVLAPGVVVYSEFLSTDALHYGAAKTMEMLHFDPAIEHPFIVQIFGNRPEHFIDACRIIEDMGADGIDINMGCPAAKVVSSCHGSALIKDVSLARSLVAAAVSAVKIPISVKTRLGWENADELIPFCHALADAGAAALCIHGRTYRQKFSGNASWEPIYELKKSLKIPVIGNGDICRVEDALSKVGNLDGVMVGRAAMGNPFLIRDISLALNGHPWPPSSVEEAVQALLLHCTFAVRLKGELKGIIEMRKHFSGYFRSFPGAKQLRMRLLQTKTLAEVQEILHEAVHSLANYDNPSCLRI